MDTMSKRQQASILYIPHGGGPLPLLGDPGHRDMIRFLEAVTSRLGKPSAILVISAHWEERRATITGGATPGLIYDYYGFPDTSYHIQYPAPGEPVLAQKIYDLLSGNGVEGIVDEKRGFDHGLFVPLIIMYPEAGIPCVQLSLLKGLDPRGHIRLGTALSELLKENILILGSGFSFHNMNAFDFQGHGTPDPRNESFQQWLVDTCTRSDLTEQERSERLVQWQMAPHARYCHPREEHLLPLHVCYGVAQAAADQVFEVEILGKKANAFLWSPA